MTPGDDSLLALVERLSRKAPEYFDLISAESDADFENAFDAILERAVSGLEANKKNLADLNEVGLSSVLALAISMPGLTVTPETYSNGHVDLTITADHCYPIRKMLGEAKIYGGPEKHVEGLDQLLGRYSTGREGRGLLIEYVKKQDIAGLVKKLRSRLDTDQPLGQQGPTGSHPMKWAFVSKHAHSSGEVLGVVHVGCNLHNDLPESSSGKS